MKKIFALAVFCAVTLNAVAGITPGWLRKSSISPDGKNIVFAYQGDLFIVGREGGQARQLTSNQAYDSDPLWSPDSKEVIFSSYREESKDIWKVSSEGGAPVRLTSFSGNETPLAVRGDGTVLFVSNIQEDALYGGFPGKGQLYGVSTQGGKIRQILPFQAGNVSVNSEGAMLYEDVKGYEDPLRKHHTSSVTRDIWVRNVSGSFTKISTFSGENRNPVFAADGDTFYFLCEQSGSFNVWKSSLSTPGIQTQVTDFSVHPVRNLSISGEGTLLFSYNGDLYTCRDGEAPAKVGITLTKDTSRRDKVMRSAAFGATDIAVSPNGKEIAIISSGDVYVVSTEAKISKRISFTPQQERGISFSEDGRTVYYASERDGEWAIWKTSLTEKGDKYMSVSAAVKEERVTGKGKTCLQPQVSPDGKWLAFLQNRTDIVIKDIRTGSEKVLLQGANYSYRDGDLDYAWSPDSRYILSDYMADGGWNNPDVAMIDIESGRITNLTESGYSDANFHWAVGGKAMTWNSDRNGFRSHGSWGSENDVYIMFFDKKAFSDFRKDQEVENIEKMLKDDDKSSRKEEKKDSIRQEKKDARLEMDLENLEDRTIRLTSRSGRIGDHFLTEDGSKLYFMSQNPEGASLYCLDIRKKSLKSLGKSISGTFYPSPDGKYIYYLSLLGVSRFEISSGQSKSISFSEEYEYDQSEERKYIFAHCWKEVSEKFYDASVHGIDWEGFKKNYEQFLPHIDNNYDFQDLLSEMLGELNASHTGARYTPSSSSKLGYIGALFDDEYQGKGLKIKEVLAGGILDNLTEAKAGDIIVSIDGKEIPEGSSWYEVFFRKASKRTLLSIKEGRKTEDVYVTPGVSDSKLLYTRWVRRREQIVKELSGGRIGYVHVKGMNSESFREVFSNALGKYRNCEALIVDTRHNGGGWLHDDLASFLNGKAYIEFRPRGQYVGTEPYNKWTKPSCVLIGEDNYSDACGFPYVYRTLGIGKLIGAPVPGTMTSVWWETQVDHSLVFGIPEVTSWCLEEDCALENFQIEPDIPVYNDPESLMRGEDKQLEAAVAEMLKEIDAK